MVESIRQYVFEGGPIAWLNVMTAAFLVILAIERLFYLFFFMSFKSEKTLERIKEFVLGRQYTDAIQVCGRNSRVPELNVICSGLLAVENGREAMKSALGGAVLEISRKCEQRVPYVALIASAATLIGLLGTIVGLIKTFSAIAAVDAAEKAKMLGEGISLAMYSTASGLSVGIAAMVVHTFCVSRIDQILGRSQDAGFKLVTWIEESERSRKSV